jgi:hypothetical protein
MPLILALLRQEDREFKASLGYTVRLCLKINKNNNGGGEFNYDTVYELM